MTVLYLFNSRTSYRNNGFSIASAKSPFHYFQRISLSSNSVLLNAAPLSSFQQNIETGSNSIACTIADFQCLCKEIPALLLFFVNKKGYFLSLEINSISSRNKYSAARADFPQEACRTSI